MIPIGLSLTPMGVSASWWLESARQAEQAGFSAVWCWDHFMGRGKKTTPVLECWSTLAAAAHATSSVRLGSFVTNVMNRHPSVLARVVATVADLSNGRVEFGIGVGGYQPEMDAYGIAFPAPAERVAILEEAVAVLRLLWAGGPANYEGRYFQLHDAWAYPVLDPAPRVIVGGEKPAGARLAARVGDGWTTLGTEYDQLLPIYLAELEAHGRARADIDHLIAVSLARDEPLAAQPLIADMATFIGEWQERGAQELIVDWVRPEELPALLDAVARAGISSDSR